MALCGQIQHLLFHGIAQIPVDTLHISRTFQPGQSARTVSILNVRRILPDDLIQQFSDRLRLRHQGCTLHDAPQQTDIVLCRRRQTNQALRIILFAEGVTQGRKCAVQLRHGLLCRAVTVCGQAAGRRSGFSGQRQGRIAGQPRQHGKHSGQRFSHATGRINQGGGIPFQGSKTGRKGTDILHNPHP
ncbi:Uncharacterised protein [Shigella sonnei]|nr:Uncharacterised protein [Shigella sonnei]CSS94300.1 Uncharacterised protein [Shigella sonnei]